MSHSESQENATTSRRKFILNELETKGQFSYEDLKEEAAIREKGESIAPVFGYSSQSIIDDLKAIRRTTSLDIREGFESGKKVFYNAGRKFLSTKALRELEDAPKKAAIAAVLGGLVLGEKIGRRDSEPRYEVPKLNRELIGYDSEILLEEHEIGNPRRILDGIRLWTGRKTTPLYRRVTDFYAAMSRLIAIDAGTTMDSFAKNVLAGAKIGKDGMLLSSLEVCVNSRSLFNILGDPNVEVRTLMLGGFQEESTETLCGAYTERIIEALDLTFGITIVGATAVDLGRRQFGADHARDAKIKLSLLDRGCIRVVAADSSKFNYDPIHRYVSFAPISSESVDLIVTDSFENVMKSLTKDKLDRGEGSVDYLKNLWDPTWPVIIEAGGPLLRLMESRYSK